MAKKVVGWIAGIVVLIGAGGILARYNTHSMAHVLYQRVTHHSTDSPQSNRNFAKIQTNNDQKAKNNGSSSVPDNVRQILTNKNYTGAYVVANNGKLSQTKYIGKNADQGNDKLYVVPDPENMLTAAAVLNLVNQGKLQLSTPVNQYYRSIATSKRMTVKDLLNMTSGLSVSATPSNQLADMLNWNINNAQAGTMGQYNYQAINYLLLEGIIAKVTKQSYQDYISNTFFKPNGLNNIKFASQVSNNQLVTAFNNGQTVAAADVTKEINGQMGQNQLVASPADFLKLTQTLVKDYGNNPDFVGNQPTGRLLKDGNMFYISGSMPGYQMAVAVSADSKKGILLMSNNSNGKDDLTAVVKEAYNKLK